MSIKGDFVLKSGEVYVTENSDDAFFVRLGVLEVYVVSYADGDIGRRAFIYEANENEILPGYCYTDMNYVNRRFLFVSQGTVEISVIKNGATKKLKSDFLSKLGIVDSHEIGFNESISDMIRVTRVSEDNFITRSQILREDTSNEIDELINKGANKRLDGTGCSKYYNSKDVRGALDSIKKCVESIKTIQAFGLIALMLLVSLLFFLFPYYLLVAFGDVTESKILFTSSVIISIIICGVVSYINMAIVTNIATNQSQKIQGDICKKIFSLNNRFFKDYKTSYIAHIMLKIEAVSSMVVKKTYVFLSCILLSFLCVCVSFVLSPILAIMGIVLFLIVLLIYVFSVHKIASIKSIAKVNREESSSLIYQFVSGIIKIRLSGAEERALLEYLKPLVNEEIAKEQNYRSKKFYDNFFTAFSVMALGAVFVSSKLILDNNSLGELLAFLCVYVTFILLVIKCVDAFVGVMDINRDINRTSDVLEKYDDSSNSRKCVPEINGDLTLEDVSFAYDSKDRMVLDDISLHISKGEYIAVVGESGSGKSTLLRLLIGFENATRGSVCFGGVDIKDIDIKYLRKHIGTVLQDGKLISATIEENITVSKPDANKKDIADVIKLVGLEKDLKTMPMGTQTMLSEESEIISGGQRQKILIARALLHKPKILLFDEATSALDNEAQKVIVDALDKLKVTRIVVAHRLSTITGCDRIIVLNNGTIAEEGTYEQLMDKHGLFYFMAKRQII